MGISKVTDINRNRVQHAKPHRAPRKTYIIPLIALFFLSSLVIVACQRPEQKNYRRETPRKLCNCVSNSRKSMSPKTVKPIHAPVATVFKTRAQSTCSGEATLLGPGQKVISFSLFTSNGQNVIDPAYFVGLQKNLKEMKIYYPDWVIRVYSNIDLKKPLGQGQGQGQRLVQGHPQLCPLICKHQNYLFFCNVKDLPTLGDVSQNLLPMAWRFLALGDPTVWKFAVRDLDSRPSQRERDAVAHWENSSFPLHGMRDYPLHSTSIMGGMWGGDNVKLGQRLSKSIQQSMLTSSSSLNNDQNLLINAIYSGYSKLILTHDSYLCDSYRDSVPFPSKRPNDFEFVGRPYAATHETGKEFIDKETGKRWKLPHFCPVECRPSYGKDWDYC